MAATPSNMLELGTQAPDFKLFNPIKNIDQTLNELKSEIATVIMFICNHCPYVIHINNELVRTSDEYLNKGVSFIGINSNNVEKYPEDSPEKMIANAEQYSYKFPYLFDETQEVAKSYKAACTPDFYIFDKNLKLVYRGQFDDSRPGNGKPVTGNDIRKALDSILINNEIDSNQIPSIGCNIKWK
jgi:thiol-disulfide isomerase/thioredoxin